MQILLRLFSLADVADVSLDDRVAVHRIDIPDELHIDSSTVGGLQGDIRNLLVEFQQRFLAGKMQPGFLFRNLPFRDVPEGEPGSRPTSTRSRSAFRSP